MSIEKTVDVPASGQLSIQIPSALRNRKRVKLVINEIDEELENQISIMQKAALDQDFLSDLEEVNNDFDQMESRVEE